MNTAAIPMRNYADATEQHRNAILKRNNWDKRFAMETYLDGNDGGVNAERAARRFVS
jgi:hypothetical protein